MPAYWFMYNMYALARNTWKYQDRDMRTEKIQYIEYDYLAPDTINEIFIALDLLQKARKNEAGEYYINEIENSSRSIQIIKLEQAVEVFKDLVLFYGVLQLIQHIRQNKLFTISEIKNSLPAKIQRTQWINVGGQLMIDSDVEKLKQDIKKGKISSWGNLHSVYKTLGSKYSRDKLSHAYTSLLEILNITSRQFTLEIFKNALNKSISVKKWMCDGIVSSREKDYTNPYRRMTFDSKVEMEQVMGKFEDNSFIQQQLKEGDEFKKEASALLKKLKE